MPFKPMDQKPLAAISRLLYLIAIAMVHSLEISNTVTLYNLEFYAMAE